MQIEALLQDYRESASQFSTARGHRVYLEEYKKSMFSLLMKEAEREGHKTAAAQEREAYSNEKYVEWLSKLQVAVQEDERLRFRVKAIEMEVEVWRSKNATERFERRSYGA